MVNCLYGKLSCYDAKQVAGLLATPPPQQPADRQGRRALVDVFAAGGAMRWQSDLGESNKFAALSMVLAPNAVIAVVQQQQKNRAQPQWYVAAFDKEMGRQLWRQEINGKPLPDGLLVDRDGQVVVTMLDGSLRCYAARQSP